MDIPDYKSIKFLIMCIVKENYCHHIPTFLFVVESVLTLFLYSSLIILHYKHLQRLIY